MFDMSAVARRIRLGVCVISVAASLPAVAGDPAKAAAYYEDGLTRFDKGDNPGAVIQLKNALQQDPSMLSAHVLLGRALLKETELPAAEAAFEQALKLGVSPVEIAAPRARLLMMLGRSKQLLRDVSPNGLMGDDLVEVLTLRAKAQSLEGDRAAALAGFEAAIQTDPSSPRPYLDLVPFLIQGGDLKGADARVQTLMRIAPDNADTWNLSASLHHVRGRLSEALVDYDKALSIDPNHTDARVARASLYVDRKQDDKARVDLDYLAEHARREPRSAYLRALVAARAGDQEGAHKALTEVAGLVDSLPGEYVAANEQLLMLGALAHHGLESREKAKEYLDTLLRRFPRNLGARKLLAAIYLDENDNARALSTVEPVLEAQPNDPQANLLAGRAHLGYRHFIQARELLTRAVKYLDKGPQALFALGLSQLGMGDTAVAIDNLEKAAAADPGDVSIGTALITVYMQRGATTKALAHAEALVAKAPKSLPALNLLGSVRAAAGQPDKAAKVFEQALAQDPKFAPALLNLVRVEVELGRVDGAEARLQAWLKEEPNDARAMFEMGRIAEQLGRQKEGIDWLRKAASKQPGQAQPALALVEALSRAGQPAEALTAAKEVGLRHPDDLGVQAVLGQAYLAAGDPKAARQTFRNMTRIAEFDPAAQVRIGRLMLGAGFPDDAEYNLQKALTARTDFAPAHALAIDIALHRGQVDTARKALEALRKSAPNDPGLLRYQGTIALASGDGPAALKHFAQQYRAHPDARAALNLSAVQERLGDLAAAEATLRDEQARHATPVIYDALGQILERQAKWAEARDAYRRLLRDAPDSPGILNRLARVQFELKDAGAMATADKARALAPNDPRVIDTVGWLRLQSGDVDGALALLRDARLRAPGLPEIRYHLAEALARSGRTGEAEAELAAALADGRGFRGADEARALQQRLQK
ncbi:PEP-CTERM system TPR-repeat protein PrsT [Nitrogeniibacter mangrovi]|uniref:PEP-CTERM system TPR-repeat protein PrsT n=1 Tax=Nitrogeniibacter mangrovi TaxID=2016596 RepID=A0A6C1B1C6_9RHOO|nr:XrtA/PEP-CTERM system TPR-repeat protein PrsT [Nitrogeniibacter mangrovi]QID16715.1 PEP-CTERM system TPR-repeat protein PrsT [Nitrogeniibacter mangrovi]